MDYENAVAKIGSLKNSYQICLFFACIYISSPVDSIVFMFMSLKTNYRCNWNSTLIGQNLSLNILNVQNLKNINERKCDITIESGEILKCTSWIFDNYNTLISEFNLVCDNGYIVNLLQGAFWLGLCASFYTGIVADKYGRKKSICVLLSMYIMSCLLCVASVNPWMFYAFHFLKGVSIGFAFIGLILMLELSNTTSRIVVGNFYWTGFSFFYCLNSLIAYYLPYWRYLQLASAVWITPALFIVIFLIPESPRWYMTKGRVTDAQNTLDKIAKLNKVDSVDLNKVIIRDEGNIETIPFKLKGVWIRIITVVYSWFAVAAVYYGISLNVHFATNDPYISNLLMGLCEFIIMPISVFISFHLGYKKSIYLSLIISILALITIYFSQELLIVRAILAIIGKTSITCSFSIIIIFTEETFSTDIRNTGHYATNLSRLSGLVVPYIASLSKIHQIIPNVIYVLFGVGIILAIMPFPETKGKPLLQKAYDLPKITYRNFIEDFRCNKDDKEIEVDD